MYTIDLMTTSTVCVVGSDWTKERLRQRKQELVDEAYQSDEVRAAQKVFDEASAEVEKFQKRQSELNGRAIALSKSLAASRERLRKSILDGSEFEDAAFMEQGTIETEYKGCNSALEMLVAEIIPEAKADLLAAQIDLGFAQSDALLRAANARAGRIAQELSAIADAEGSIEVNVRDTPIIAVLMGAHHNLFGLANRGREELKKIREHLKSTTGKKG